jgi:hypothetical protein
VRFDGFAGRSTFSNDAWIRSDLVNSAATFFLGTDTRNYYRADRGEIIGHYLFETSRTDFEPLLGVRSERAWSVRPDSDATGGPWSLFGHHAHDGILRPNPRIDDGTITSALVGGRLNWQGQGGVVLGANDVTEIAGASPVHHGFVQSTVHATIGFPTFGSQRFDLETHAVFTAGDSTPRQRWAYLGGSATLPFLGLLSEGGDQLLFIDSRYSIPIDAITLPFVGAPTLALRDVIGGAGVGRLPALEHNVGVRVSLSFLKFDAMLDPSRRRVRFSTGLSMSR